MVCTSCTCPFYIDVIYFACSNSAAASHHTSLSVRSAGIMVARRVTGKTPDPARLKAAEKAVKQKKRDQQRSASPNESTCSRASSGSKDRTRRRLTFDDEVKISPIEAENPPGSKKESKGNKGKMTDQEADEILAKFTEPPSVCDFKVYLPI